MKYSICYAVLQFATPFFREAQGLVYLKVAQAAFVQLSLTAFSHLHSLLLDWHLRKKLGVLLVVIIFATYFKFFPLSVTVFFFIFVYMVVTIVRTLWRKRFRKKVAESDNNWHEICTDSLVNFETVKYFTAEQYEL